MKPKPDKLYSLRKRSSTVTWPYCLEEEISQICLYKQVDYFSVLLCNSGYLGKENISLMKC